jgi:ClpX C4-type zinc finger
VVWFEIRVNGEHRFRGDNVTAVTLVSERVGRRACDRVLLHVGEGEAPEREIHHLGADLAAGDEISIRLLDDAEGQAQASAPEACSFCARDIHHLHSLVAGQQVAICDGCISSFESVVKEGAPLPLGALVQEDGEARCGFCEKARPTVAGLLVRNEAAICPECLRVCAEIRGSQGCA